MLKIKKIVTVIFLIGAINNVSLAETKKCDWNDSCYGSNLQVTINNLDSGTYQDGTPHRWGLLSKSSQGRCVHANDWTDGIDYKESDSYRLTPVDKCWWKSAADNGCHFKVLSCSVTVCLCDRIKGGHDCNCNDPNKKKFVLEMKQDEGGWCAGNRATERVYVSEGAVYATVIHGQNSCIWSDNKLKPCASCGNPSDADEVWMKGTFGWNWWYHFGKVTVNILPQPSEGIKPEIKTKTVTIIFDASGKTYNLLDAQEAINMIYKNLLIVPTSQRDKYQYYVDKECIGKDCKCSLENNNKQLVCKLKLTRSPV